MLESAGEYHHKRRAYSRDHSHGIHQQVILPALLAGVLPCGGGEDILAHAGGRVDSCHIERQAGHTVGALVAFGDVLHDFGRFSFAQLAAQQERYSFIVCVCHCSMTSFRFSLSIFFALYARVWTVLSGSPVLSAICDSGMSSQKYSTATLR